MIRATDPADVPAILSLTAATGVFKESEVEVLAEVLADYFDGNRELGHRCVTDDDTGVRGFAYYAPAAMTDRTWYLYWIAVDKRIQAKGVGGALLRYAEDEIRSAGGRVLLIETSGLENYEPTRRFYLKCGYDREATLRDFYADGDDMVVFRKRLTASSRPSSR